jgi:hypothetical protein
MLNEDHIDKPVHSWEMRIDFGDIPSSGRDVLLLENVSAGYGEHMLLQDSQPDPALWGARGIDWAERFG